jgi:hypothetical protein
MPLRGRMTSPSPHSLVAPNFEECQLPTKITSLWLYVQVTTWSFTRAHFKRMSWASARCATCPNSAPARAVSVSELVATGGSGRSPLGRTGP